MVLTDTLDMVGVQLCATWTQTRTKNGNILKEKVSKICRSWKAGKFMPVILRPYSINTFVLSKLWFRSSNVNLRVGDVASFNSSIKSWIYADFLVKPEEETMFRQRSKGGLGVIWSIKKHSHI